MADYSSFQDQLDDLSSEIFVGRESQLDIFERMLAAGISPYLILDVSGQGGVGKSTLLRRFQRVAERNGSLAVFVDESQPNVLAVLKRIAEQMSAANQPLKKFEERYRKYRELRQQLEADQAAPKGLLSFAFRGALKIGFRVVRRVPVAGDAADVFLNGESEKEIIDHAHELAAYVARKFTNKDEQELILEPEKVLTQYLLSELQSEACDQSIVFLFDTFEKTSPEIEPWLLGLLNRDFGDLIPGARLVIAGRYPLSQGWTRYRKAIRQIELKPFSEEEAHSYLEQSGITGPESKKWTLK